MWVAGGRLYAVPELTVWVGVLPTSQPCQRSSSVHIHKLVNHSFKDGELAQLVEHRTPIWLGDGAEGCGFKSEWSKQFSIENLKLHHGLISYIYFVK